LTGGGLKYTGLCYLTHYVTVAQNGMVTSHPVYKATAKMFCVR